ncbi:primase-helicase family protein [Rheinheimera sp.]|uniref:primase-helicase family protein n=1 Tax=Rheinheimera sp. TaxID=1869214 RepID=UPI0027B98AB2|nr:primase-helicase family protein [Rheinheimera sp.]
MNTGIEPDDSEPMEPVVPNTINGKALSDKELAVLVGMNDKFAHVTMGGKHQVISTGFDGRNIESYQYESLTEFKNRFLHLPTIAGMNQGEAWQKWPGKRYYSEGLAFCPNPAKCNPHQYNLFRGFAIKPVAGTVEPFIQHVTQVVCAADLQSAKYVLQFFAHMLQKPDEKPSVAIVMKSIEGTGKGALMQPFLNICGEYAAATNGAYQVTGRFNSVVGNKLLIFSDEVDLTDAKSADKLKALISEPTVMIERKGLDATPVGSYTRFVFASNMDTVLKAGSRERRYLVLEPSPDLAQDKDYFDRYFAWLNNNGAAHLMHYLLNLDISDFDPRKAPSTQALLDEKLASLPMPLAFMYEELGKDKPFNGMVRPEPKDIQSMFSVFLENNGERQTAAQMRSSLGKLFKDLQIKSVGRAGRGQVYDFSDMESIKQSFARRIGQSVNELFS